MLKRTESELLDEHTRSVLENVHVSIPGIVQKYHAADQTADVLPAVKKPLIDVNGETVYESHPVIANVPVAFPHGATFGMHWTLQEGDGVWLVYSELSAAEFILNGQEAEPFDVQHHGIGSPIAIPTDVRASSAFKTLNAGNRVGIDNDDAQIDFSSGKIKVVPSATLAAARKTDPVKVTLTATDYAAIAAALVCATSGSPPTVSPSAVDHDVTGSITDGSTKVDIG